MPSLGKPTAKLMNNIDRSQVRNGRKRRPLNSLACGAAWGRALGVALLMCSAMPSYAVPKPALNNETPKVKFSSDLQSARDAKGMVTVIVQHREMPTSAHLKAMQGRGATI